VTAVSKVLLSQLEEEVGAEFDVEVNITLGSLSLRDVEVKSLVQLLNCLFRVVLLSPKYYSLQIGVFRSLLLLVTYLH
jgi:hypothetical protein